MCTLTGDSRPRSAALYSSLLLDPRLDECCPEHHEPSRHPIVSCCPLLLRLLSKLLLSTIRASTFTTACHLLLLAVDGLDSALQGRSCHMRSLLGRAPYPLHWAIACCRGRGSLLFASWTEQGRGGGGGFGIVGGWGAV